MVALYAERGRHDVEALGYILADLMERAAPAWAGLVFEIDRLFDQLRWAGKNPQLVLRGRSLAGRFTCTLPRSGLCIVS